MVVLHDSRLKASEVPFRKKFREQFLLLTAAFALHGIYYRQLSWVFVRNLQVSNPVSLMEALKTVWLVLKVKAYTALLPLRLASLYRLCREIDRFSIPGDVVECGVYNGGSAALLASVCTRSHLTRNMWLFDSFEGLPPPTEKDGEKAQSCCWWCHGDLSLVNEIFDKLDIPESYIHIVKGWFHDTFPTVQIGDIALLHIDADWYESVKLCLERFYDNVHPGGYIVIDDYGHWEGCSRATDEFLNERGIEIELTRVDYTGRYFRKPSD
jgi:O-methyltransferase